MPSLEKISINADRTARVLTLDEKVTYGTGNFSSRTSYLESRFRLYE